jgi:hypothetical protein
MDTCPLVTESSPAMQCRSVDFPEPDGPITAIRRPAGTASVTSSSARTAASPVPYNFVARAADAALVATIVVVIGRPP